MATAIGGGAFKQLAMLMAMGLSAQRAGVQSAKAFGRPKRCDSSGAEPLRRLRGCIERPGWAVDINIY